MLIIIQRPHKNKPVRQPGDRAIDDGSHDRSPCKVGRPRPEKLTIEFKIECDDPKNPGKTISKPSVKFHYPHPIDWHDKKSVSNLTRWRAQLFFRVLGKKRDARKVWLKSERDALFGILQGYLVKVGGGWSQINWDLVAKELNKRFEGRIQKAGEMTAERRYDLKNKAKTKTKTNPKNNAASKGKKSSDNQSESTSQPLKNDRVAPTRSGGSLRTQITNFTHPLAQKIINQAKAEDRKSNDKISGDDDEETTNDEEDVDSDDEDPQDMGEYSEGKEVLE